MTSLTSSEPTSRIRRRIPNQDEPKPRLRLGERLIEAGLLSEEELNSALQQQTEKKRFLGELLVELGLINEADLLPYLGEQMNCPTVKLREGVIDPETVQLLPREIAARLNVLVLFRVHNELTVAMANPQDLPAIDELEQITNCSIRPVLALQSQIEDLLPQCYEEGFSVDDVTADMDRDAVTVHDDAFDLDAGGLDQLSEGSPIISLVNYIILQAVRSGASDIHIEPGMNHSIVRFRVDGQLREVLKPRKDFHPAIVSRVKVMGKMDIAEHRAPQDGRIHVIVEKREIDLRASTLPTVLGEKVVLRVLDRANVTFDLDKLGMQPHLLGQVKRMLNKPWGLILVTGPTGSGKTTTLYSAMELIKSVHTNIVTVEDPVEYQLERVNQVSAAQGTSVTFAKALRAILRQDPDVIMVGEIRDLETAEVAIQAALTGHLVLSTLHTNDSAGAVTRLVDMGVASYKIAAALNGVVAQRLVRQICPHCRTTYFPKPELLDLIGYQGNRNRQFERGNGCAKCYDTGHTGRIGIYEILTMEREMRELISSDPSIEKLKTMSQDQGGTTLLQEGISLAEQGLTSLDEVLRVAFHE